MSASIRVGTPAIEVSVRRHARARRMVLRVSRHGAAPTLTLPPHASVSDARAFVRHHEAWLRQRLAEQPQARRISDGTTLPFRGRTLTVRLDPASRIAIEGEFLRLPGPDACAPQQAMAALREAARCRCVEASARLAAGIGRRVGRITLRDTRSRWGSCTSSGDLMFSWRLILAPDPVLDYVVAHEVAHLVEMNHAPAFWAVVRRLCPDHEAPRAWLRRHGPELLALDFTGAD